MTINNHFWSNTINSPLTTKVNWFCMWNAFLGSIMCKRILEQENPASSTQSHI